MVPGTRTNTLSLLKPSNNSVQADVTSANRNPLLEQRPALTSSAAAANHFSAYKQHGFTLLELLVVVVIVAILFTYTTLAIRSDSAEDVIQHESLRIKRLIELALEESILRGEEYGIEFSLNSYRFLRLEKNQWLPLNTDRVLRERELPLEMELELRLEETEISIDTGNEKKSSLGETDDSEEQKKDKPEPQIYLLSSGEITPEFDIRFFIFGVETSYIIKGNFDGSVSTEKSEL